MSVPSTPYGGPSDIYRPGPVVDNQSIGERSLIPSNSIAGKECGLFWANLAYDQGLGKTISTLALSDEIIMMQRHSKMLMKTKNGDDDDVKFKGGKKKKGKKGIDGSIDYSGTLAKVSWSRVILDEAQTIKNSRTQVSKSCCGLRAKKRWCLSGTPIQNSIEELYSYFRFLKCDPYANYKSFCSQIKFPIARNSEEGYRKLQVVLKAIMLRRTKGTNMWLIPGQFQSRRDLVAILGSR
ncbi:helicase-like transcription factor CHR28 [Tanacetum coccineum]